MLPAHLTHDDHKGVETFWHAYLDRLIFEWQAMIVLVSPREWSLTCLPQSVDCAADVSISIHDKAAHLIDRGMFTVLGLDFVYDTESSLSLTLIVVFISLAGITTGLIQMLLHYSLKAGFYRENEVSKRPDKAVESSQV